MKKLRLFGVILTAFFILSACGEKQGETVTAGETVANEETVSDNTANNSTNMESGSDVVFDKDGILTVGFDQDFPPMGFVGDDGEFTGFDLALAAEVAKRLNMEIKYQPIEWAAKEMEIESESIDCIWNGFTINGREDAYTWSEPYMENKQIFVVKTDSNIKDLSALADKSVEVQADSSAEKALEDKPELKDSFRELRSVADYNTAFMDLEMGVVDAIAMDVIVAGYQIKQRKSDDYMILEEELSSEIYGIGFKKGNTALRDEVNAMLKEMAADGTMEKISDEWFGQDVTIIKGR